MTIAPKEIKLGRQLRDHAATEIRIVKRESGGTQISFSLTSETPIDRWYGTEILSHEKGAIRLDRAKGGAMPLLFNHNWDDPVGMIDGARVEGGRLVVDAHFFDTERAREVAAMVEGGLRNVSAGYQVHAFEEKVKEQLYTAVDWEPLEGSIVSVPADRTVGIGRGAAAGDELPVRLVRIGDDIDPPAAPAASSPTSTKELSTMFTRHRLQEQANDGTAGSAGGGALGTNNPLPAQPRQGPAAAELEADRVAAIDNLCRANNIDAGIRNVWVTSGASMRSISDELLGILQTRAAAAPKVTAVGLSQQETRRFSRARAIEACASQNWTQAGLEAEASREIQKRLNRNPDPNRFFVPWEIQERANRTPVEHLAYALMKRDLTVASAGAGGYLVETQNVGFIELLRNKSVLFNMGARRLSGLQGNVSIPKQSATGSATWLANEAATISEINQTFVQVAMSPKNVGGYTEISRQLLLQSNPAAEGIVVADLASVVALDIDLKGLNGSGASGQPTGILNTAGIGSVTGTSLDYADVIEFQTDVFGGNALTGQSGYVTTGAVAGLMKQRVKFTSTASPLWEGQLAQGMMDGYRAMASNQMPSATMLFGDFDLGVVVGEWGVLEIETNPYANFQAGIVGVRAIASIDIAVRYPTAFSAAASIT